MELEKYFVQGYDFLVIPNAVRNVPIVMAKMLREDGSYHSIATLEETLGSLFVPTHIIDERFIVIHYGFSRSGEEALFKTFMQSAGLVDMRSVLDSVADIDFGALNGNEFGIFSAWEIHSVPRIESAV